MTGLAAEVALDGATNAYDRLYSYALPKNCGAVPGCRVTVPFGKGNIKKQGMIFIGAAGIAVRTIAPFLNYFCYR